MSSLKVKKHQRFSKKIKIIINYINKQDQCIELTRTKILTKTKDEQRPNTQNCKTDRVDETILSSGIEGRLLVKSLHLCGKYRFYCIKIRAFRKKRSAFRITLRELPANSKYDTVRSNSNKTSWSGQIKIKLACQR